MRARVALACALLAGCSALNAPPSLEDETGGGNCHDSTDNDLDGEMDCADPGCAGVCPDRVDVQREPALTPCPAEWAEVSAEGEPTRCEPDHTFGPACDVGDPRNDCPPIGSSCDGFVLDPRQPVLYVAQGGTGDGSAEDSPLGSIEEAVRIAAPGAQIAIRGVHNLAGALRLERPVTLVGECSSRTLLLTDDREEVSVEIAADDVVLRDLTLANGGPDPRYLVLAAGVRGGLVGVELFGVPLHLAAGAEVTASYVRISLQTVDELESAAVVLEEEATFDGHHVEIRDGLTGCVDVAPGASLALDRSQLAYCAGALVTGTGRLRLRETILDHVRILAACEPRPNGAPCVELDSCVVRDEAPMWRTDDGALLELRGGRARVARVTFEGGTGHGVVAAAGELWLEDVIVRDTQPFRNTAGAVGLLVSGGSVDARRVAVLGSGEAGVRVASGALRAHGLEIDNGAQEGSEAVGLEVGPAGAAVLSSFWIHDGGRCGLRLEAGASLIATEGLLESNERGACVAAGAAITTAELTHRVTYRDNLESVEVEDE